MDWLDVQRADTPLILAFPHGGTMVPEGLRPRFVSDWTAIRDADWHIDALYDGLAVATLVATAVSRSVIDVNRDPSGVSLYPGQATTALCPTTDFDGAPLYRPGAEPDEAEIAQRRATWFDPYHAALAAEIARLRKRHGLVVLYDCHSIRSRIPRLFDGELPELNIGTNGGATCDPALGRAVTDACASSGRSCVLDGRFRGGWTTRHYGRPEKGIHAIQMEISIRAYADEPAASPDPDNWPPKWDGTRAAALRADLRRIVSTAAEFGERRA
jgi:N-formylglutamate deformylase